MDLVGALASLSWKHGYLVPYTYGMYTYLRSGVINKAVIPDVNIHLMALAYFLLFTLVGYALYVTKKEKG
jgi:lantibiotic transport system permease protein